MKKRPSLKINPQLISSHPEKFFSGWKLISLLTVSLLSFLLYPLHLSAADQDRTSSIPLTGSEKEVPAIELESVLAQLRIPQGPISREGAGYLIAQAPGERYKVQFRLLAQGPESFRLEIFDLLGRPAWYLISYNGQPRLFSLSQRKEFSLNQDFSGPLAALSLMPVTEMIKVFWGRVPLLAYGRFQLSEEKKNGQRSIRLFLKGAGRQELLINTPPFSLIKSQIVLPEKAGELEVTFSEFSTLAESRIPLKCEINQRKKEQNLVIRYETLIPRDDIPEEVFQYPDFSLKTQ
jgi:hypothetical protein